MAVISGHGAGTGIQRVVRAIALALLEQNNQWDIQFVAAKRKRRYYHITWPERSPEQPIKFMSAKAGDIFLGLDYSLDAVRRHRRQLAKFRRDGGKLWFLVHDLLPLNRPEWFSHNTVIRYRAWLSILAQIADGFFCNSPHTEVELKQALAQFYRLNHGYRTQVLPMGYAITDHYKATKPIPVSRSERFDTAMPFALMVGTLEPRKGHTDIIKAFDILWQTGSSYRLLIIGELGWHVESLRDLILTHRQLGDKLAWLTDVNDTELSHYYKACCGVIIASHGEGFGLPLIEALGHGKPVLARDLPVFRMHEGHGVHFFPATVSPDQLAKIALN